MLRTENITCVILNDLLSQISTFDVSGKVLQYARAGKLCWGLITESPAEQFLGKEHFV